MKKIFQPVALIILYHEGKFLLTKRRVEPNDDQEFDGYWQVPGGGVGWGEDIATSAIREAREEIGVDVAIERTLGVTEKVNIETGWHGVFMAFLCRQTDPSQPIQINHEAYEYGWFSIDQIHQLRTLPSTEAVLKYVYLYYRLFSLGSLAVIVKDGKYLLTKIFAPDNPAAHGKWGFIAGITEPSEKLEDTVRRECREEVGVDVKIDRLLPHIVEQENFKLFCYQVHLRDPDQAITLNSEASEWGWYTKDEIVKLDVYGDTLEILKLL